MRGLDYAVRALIILIMCASTAAACRANTYGSPRCTVMFECDLVRNGGFEDELGSLDIDHVVPPSSWMSSGHATVLQYGGFDGLPIDSDKEPSAWRPVGNNFLAGGPAGSSSRDARVWQRIELGSAAPLIRHGGVTFTLSAVLGGRAGKPDFAGVWIHFLDEKLIRLRTR